MGIRPALRKFAMAIETLIAALAGHWGMQSKSTVLRPLSWLSTICAAAILGAVRFNAPNWLIIVLAVSFCMTLALYLGAFVYCLATDKDSLRTERYSIQKLAIEKGLRGDSTVGLFRLGKTKEMTLDQDKTAQESSE